MAYSGRFTPSNPQKYIGDPNNIIYRSSWECKVMNWLDKNPDILSWASEELIIPYISPVDGQRLMFRIKDNGTSRTITWTTGSANTYREIGVTLPAATTVSKTMYVGCVYNTTDARWDAIAYTLEA